MSIKGKLLWSDTDEPVADVSVQVHANDGTVIGSARSNDDGRYELRVPARQAARPIYVVITSAQDQIIHTTRDAPVALQGQAAQLDSIVPGGGPAVRARWASALDLGAAALHATRPEDVLQIARSLVAPRPITPMRATAAVPGLEIERSLCGTPVLEAIEEAIRTKGWPRAIGHQVDDILEMRDSGLPFASPYQSANFSVTYQTSGPAAVPSSTASEPVLDPGTSTTLTTIGDGVTPTYVLRIVYWLERALAAYIAPPFSMKNPAASGKIPVVINTAPYGSASPSGTFYLNHNLPADLICAVGVHELFHMVQFQYGTNTGPWRGSLIEGGAVFAEDSAADKLNRYLDEAGSNFNGIGTQANPNLSLVSAGYKCCLFWRYIAEQQSPDITEPFVGVETYRNVLEHCAAGGFATADVKSAVRELPWYQDLYEFSYLDPQRLDLTNSETVLGNYALACYLKDLGTNVPDRRFEFIEDEENIYIDEVVGGPASSTLASPTLTAASTLGTTGTLAFTGSVNPFAHRYYEIAIDPAVTNVEVAFTAGSGLTSSLVQLALIDQDGKVRDLHRSDRSSYTKRVVNMAGGKRLSKVVAVVTGANTGGPFSLAFSPAAAAPDVMVTRWHTVAGKEYEIDSRNWAWTWVSPDLWVDNNDDGVADGPVFNTDNKLHIRLHNKGNLAAKGIQIEAFYQNAALGLSPTAWKPVTDKLGVKQVLTGLSMAAGTTQDWVMKWSPQPIGASHHFCVRVVVTVPGDPNTDNKRAISNFSAVKLKRKDLQDLKIVLAELAPRLKPGSVQVVPRLQGRPDLKISTRDIRELGRGDLTALPELRISYVPVAATPHAAAPSEGQQVRRLPDQLVSYRTDPRALPPGVAGKPMVTIGVAGKDMPSGGVTFLVDVES
ncbi:MAG TPA: hypothetical protein VFT22_04740 [Kofleriaceae bacterium]|nr:hypothetical protein [Kofleriaceae bacterium]